MSIQFEKLTPSKLSKTAIVPQVLDNQWVPRKILAEMIKNKKGLGDIRAEREKHILKEWRRALIYAEQVVVNRAFIFSNNIIVDDYDDAENRRHFKDLLGTKVIVPYLYTEDTPDQKPVFQIEDHLWNSWMDIVKDTQMSCVRLDWGEQKDDFEHLAKVFHNYIKTLDAPNQPEFLAAHFDVPKQGLDAFKSKIYEVVDFTTQIGRNGKYVTRNDLYGKFITEPGTAIPEGKYNNQPYTDVIKQIIDLKYNVNLPDALGRYALTPEDSHPRSALGDLQSAVESKTITDRNINEIVYSLQRLAFDQIAQGLYIKNLNTLALGDVVKIRDTPEWRSYNSAMKSLLKNPLEFADRSARLYAKFEKLNERITRLRMENTRAAWEPWVKFMITVGSGTAILWLNPTDPTDKFLTTTVASAVSNGITPFLMRMSISALTNTNADLDISLDFMRGNIQNGRDTWNEMLGQLSSKKGFKKLEKSLSETLDSNQNQPEATPV